MDTDKDKELQNRDRDREQQGQERKGYKRSSEADKSQKITGNPERLRDINHRMNRRINDVQGEVDFGGNERHDNEDLTVDLESRWNDIEKHYRKRYPNITDADVNYRPGEFVSMTDRLAKRTNRNREDIAKEIRDWDSSIQKS